jgi:hypothetical protein
MLFKFKQQVQLSITSQWFLMDVSAASWSRCAKSFLSQISTSGVFDKYAKTVAFYKEPVQGTASL